MTTSRPTRVTLGLSLCLALSFGCKATESAATGPAAPGAESTHSANPAAALDNQVLTVPCPGTPNNGEECTFPQPQHKASKAFQLGGDPNTVYKVTLKFCGVWEGMKYASCKTPDPTAPNVCIGGLRSNDGNDADYPTLALAVKEPARTYYLNKETDILDRVFKFQYSASFEMKGGTTVDLVTDGGGNDGHYTARGPGGAHTCDTAPPGITQPYFGQFWHVQVVSAVPAN